MIVKIGLGLRPVMWRTMVAAFYPNKNEELDHANGNYKIQIPISK